MNKTIEEIKMDYKSVQLQEEDIRQSLRNFLSRNLMDTNEDEPLKCNINILCGNIISMWQHPSEGWIVFEFRDGVEMEFDDLDTWQLIEIISEL